MSLKCEEVEMKACLQSVNTASILWISVQNNVNVSLKCVYLVVVYNKEVGKVLKLSPNKVEDGYYGLLPWK